VDVAAARAAGRPVEILVGRLRVNEEGGDAAFGGKVGGVSSSSWTSTVQCSRRLFDLALGFR
jgi:hypothetical protein